MSFQARISSATRTPDGAAIALTVGLCPKPMIAGEKPPVPAMRVPYNELGFPGYAPALMRVGTYSMSTLHMLDSKHVLFTFSLRSLVPRLPGDDERDTDRLVAAEIIELPEGKVVARTQWRLHDHGRYLWRAGHGLFILRTADELSAFAPLRGLESGHPFERIAIPHRPGLPVVVATSPDGAILTVQVQEPGQTDDTELDGTPMRRHAIIEFYRISTSSAPEGPVELKPAGPVVGSPNFLHLPLDGDGYLWAENQNRGNWLVTFNEFGGKQEKLATIHSSCGPRLSLLSRGEFLAETCRGMDEAPMLASFGFDGHENWEEPVGTNLQPPTIVTAAEAGRFAISRLTTNSGGSSGTSTENPMAQELRVYQTESGDMLLRLQCSNPIRTSENFDLSPGWQHAGGVGPRWDRDLQAAGSDRSRSQGPGQRAKHDPAGDAGARDPGAHRAACGRRAAAAQRGGARRVPGRPPRAPHPCRTAMRRGRAARLGGRQVRLRPPMPTRPGRPQQAHQNLRRRVRLRRRASRSLVRGSLRPCFSRVSRRSTKARAARHSHSRPRGADERRKGQLALAFCFVELSLVRRPWSRAP